MKTTQILPEDYRLLKKLDLIKDKKLFIYLNLIGIGLFVACWLLLDWLVLLLRPDIGVAESRFVLTIDQGGSILAVLLTFLLVFFTMVIFHEAIHGLFFWWFTRGKVKFAFKGAYAYAAAPDWYLPKRPYMIVSLAPLVLMTLMGVAAMLVVPLGWISPIMLVVALNAAGAIGDIYVFFLLLRMPEDVLVQDFGEKMEIYSLEDGKSTS